MQEQPYPMPKTFYYLMGVGDNSKKPTFKHESLESAENEARRLIESGKAESIEILQCVGVFLAKREILQYKLE